VAKKHLKTDPIVRRSATPPGTGTDAAAAAAAARARAARLAVVRMALVTAVLATGGIVWLIRRNGGGDPLSGGPGLSSSMRSYGTAIWFAALAGIVYFWYMIPRARDERRRSAYTIFAWAAAEAPALFGAAYYYLTGDSRWYISGVTLLVASLLAVPGKR
jgi:hypothetical protein